METVVEADWELASAAKQRAIIVIEIIFMLI